MHHKVLGLLAGVCALSIAPCAVAADASGAALNSLLFSADLAVSGGVSGWTGDDVELSSAFAGYGLVSLPTGASTSFQFDGNFSTMNGNDDTLSQSISVGGHMLWRDPNHHQVGFFAGIGHSTVEGNEPYPSYVAGVEGQLYLQNVTVFGQAAYVFAHENSDPTDEPLSVGVLRGGVYYFFDPTFMAEGEATAAFGNFDGDATTILQWGAELRKQLTAMNGISIFGRYEGGSYACCATNDVNQVFKLGIAKAIGAPDLLTQNRYGANTNLPQFPEFTAIDAVH